MKSSDHRGGRVTQVLDLLRARGLGETLRTVRAALALRAERRTDEDWDRRYGLDTFVEYGSGKARVLFLAAELGFKRIIGVEFAPQLHEVALRNLASYRRHRPHAPPIEPVLGDAANFDIPKEPCFLYFYTPFKTELLTRVLATVAESYRANPRPMLVGYAYVLPYHIAQSSSIPGFAEIPTRRRLRDFLQPPCVHLRLFASAEARG